MKWRQLTGLAEESECKRYTMAASRVQGRWKFQAWRRAPEGSAEMATLLGTCDFTQDAKKLCSQDARAQKKAA